MINSRNILIFLGVILLVGFTLEKNLPDTPIALVKKIVKDVTYRSSAEKSDWEKAKVGLPLNSGGEVKTGSNSLALVLFSDGSGLLRVRENSILHIYGDSQNKRMNKNTVINKGLVGFEVNKQAEDEEFKFTTPTVVASIRGTDGYIAFSDNDSTSSIYLNSGSALFTTVSGEQGAIVNGRTLTVKSDGSYSLTTSTADDSLRFKNSTLTNTRQIRLRTPFGDLILDILDNR
jgi:hypothetical protein